MEGRNERAVYEAVVLGIEGPHAGSGNDPGQVSKMLCRNRWDSVTVRTNPGAEFSGFMFNYTGVEDCF